MAENNQKDLVLSVNEYAYVLDETKGNVSCWVGPAKTSLSNSDRLVRFDEATKSFVNCSYSQAISLFTTAPENWYVILKNPMAENRHPTLGTSNALPEKQEIGRKINIRGPVTFALYPGQMAKVVKGHTLRSNQYLLARVYDAESANTSDGKVVTVDGQETKANEKYITGQILVIKGTEVSFYIPPTGIEVIPIHNDVSAGYVRDAVTLERLEYCILKDEDGNKRYVHGPKVVFPEPTEQFVKSLKGGYIFRAIELSPISGIYVKVIAEYKDNNGKIHPVGEELFITGNETMIYYPRPEHAIISYDNKMMHHAIAIPEGEGRYIMNRLTGEIKTVRGPKMYLPDPRTEVVVKRKLTKKQCQLWFPGNNEALDYNLSLTEQAVEKRAKAVDLDEIAFSALSMDSSLASLEAKANISRGTSYTKPRTITLDNKFDGVVSVDVWTGYAVNKISKNGNREIVCGPQTILLDYDQTFEEIALSTGKPKTTDNLLHTVFLRYLNNKVSDIVNAETKDFVSVQIKVSYTINFEDAYRDHWFDIDNYVKYACDRERSLIKSMAKEYTIEEFYQKYNHLVHDTALGHTNLPAEKDPTNTRKYHGLFFPQNGMCVTDCEVLSIYIEDSVMEQIEEHQNEMIEQALRLSNAEKRIQIAEQLAAAEKKEHEVESIKLIHKMDLQRIEALHKLDIQSEVNRAQDAEKTAAAEAERDLQVILDAVHAAKMAREQKENDATMEWKRQEAELVKAKQQAYADTVTRIVASIGPDLVAAMNSKANSEMTVAIAKSLSPYAIAGDNESVSDVVNKLLRGTSLENVVEGVNLNV